MRRLQDALRNKEDNYILPFFWQHGEDEETLREYMNVIHEANIGAVCIESRPHPDFVGEKWWMDMDVILDEAKHLNMKVWILDDSHFPTGFANGAIKNAPKELHHKYMCYRTLEMAGPVSQVEFNLKQYMQPAPPPPWIPAPPKSDDDLADDKLVTVLACPVLEKEELGEPIDLTGNLEDGQVVFDLPDGYFKIFVVYITRNGKGRNNYINFMDKDSCKLLIDTVYEPHFEHYRQYFGNVIAGFFSDEPPIGNVDGYMPIGPIGVSNQDLPWSDAAMKRMNEEYGSDAWVREIPYLWGTAVDKETQAKVRNAYMNMVTKLVAECFSKQNALWCEEHGVEYIGHMLEDCDMNMNLGASMGHFFRGLSGQHMAGIDNIGGQVTINGQNVTRHDMPACQDEAGFYQYVIGKLGASHAAIDPKKHGRTMCENFGAYGWQSGPMEQKFMMDHFMVRGVNRYVPHAFSPAPFPDPDCPPHFYAHGENPSYRAFGELMAYSNRVCHLIDGGTPCPDVAVLYAAESVWAGDGGSNIPVCRHLTQAQIDFHIIPADVFMEDGEYPMAFDGKILSVNGVKYQALVISGCAFVDELTAAFVEKAILTEFPVIFTDRRPHGIINGTIEENDKFVNAIEKSAVVPVQQIGTYLRNIGKIDLNIVSVPANKSLTTYHYRLDKKDEILILNEMSKNAYSGEFEVRAEGVPVRFYPWENQIERVEYKEMPEGHIKLRLTIDPLELCVILFVTEEECNQLEKEFTFVSRARKDEGIQKDYVELTEFMTGRVNSKDYLEQIRSAGKGLYPQKAIVYSKEQEALHAPFIGMQKSYPEFSGYYIYDTTVKLEHNFDYEMVIDDVYEIAEVFVNGYSLGMKVQRPYRFRIPADYLKEDNEIRIEVATLLERKVKAMEIGISAMSAERPLSPTGIVGRVLLYKLNS